MSDRYETKSSGDGIEDLSKKLTNDLRRHIRGMGAYQILSDEWKKMADNLGRIANISEMEKKLPRENEDATLWETEELALRYVLEDGKLNLCLRNLVDFKEYQRDVQLNKKDEGDDAIKEKMMHFEKGCGVMLKNAWLHVEALQTTDLPLLINFCADILQHALKHPEIFKDFKSFEWRQEGIVTHYLHGLTKRLEDIEEHRVMPIMEEREVFSMLVQYLPLYADKFGEQDMLVALEACAMIVDTEDMRTHKDRYIRDDNEREAVVKLRDLCDDYMDDLDTRRKIRPLLDCIDACKRVLMK